MAKDTNQTTHIPSVENISSYESALKQIEPSVLNSLSKEDAQTILDLKNTFIKSLNTRQIYRTETEMRISVLNDGDHPTLASKYWQAIREISSEFETIVRDSFQLRRSALHKQKLLKDLQKAKDKGNTLKQSFLEIDLEEWHFQDSMHQMQLKDRIREVKIWSKILEELNDGSFNDQDVNDHQAKSYFHKFQTKAQALTDKSSHADIINTIGPLSTIQRLDNGKGELLNFKEAQLRLNQSNQ